MSYKIWVQSSTSTGGFPKYFDGLKKHAEEILSPNISIDINGVPRGSTTDLHFFAYEFLNSRAILSNIIKAEKEGYDAVATNCFLDPVLDEARELVDIPVISLGEASMVTSLMYGKKFSIITYTPQLAKKSFPNLITKYGLEKRAVPAESFEVSLPELGDAFSNPEPVINKFLDASEKAVKNGAEVILPGCGLLNIICVQNGISKIRDTGATVLDVTGVALKMAETAIKLKEVSNTSISRASYYEKPNNIEEILRAYNL